MVSSILDISAKSEIKAKVRCPWECAGTRLEFKKVWSHLRGTANDDTQPLGERIDSTEEREMPAEGWPHAMATWRRLGRGRRTEKQRKKNKALDSEQENEGGVGGSPEWKELTVHQTIKTFTP